MFKPITLKKHPNTDIYSAVVPKCIRNIQTLQTRMFTEVLGRHLCLKRPLVAVTTSYNRCHNPRPTGYLPQTAA